MNRELTYYEILEVPTSATLTDIKNAYREKCKKNHPDVAGNTKETHELMCKINEAYEVLSNTQKRRAYDNVLRANYKEEESTQDNTHTTSSEPTKEEPRRSTEEQKEKPKEEPKTRYRWTEPVFTNADMPNKNKFKTEEDYYDYIYNYYEENDYNKEESEEYVDWLDQYIGIYIEYLQIALYMKMIEKILYRKIEEQFDVICEYTIVTYNSKYNNTVRIHNR